MEENRSKTRKPNYQEEMLMGVDRISTLPDPLIHQILLFLPTKYAARTSVLSKRWGFLWETFPVIDLKEQRHQQHLTDARERFQECLRSTISRRELSSLLLLRIQMRRQGNGDLDPLINDLVTRAITGKVKTLELNFTTHHLIVQEECDQCYVLPEIIFSSGLYLDCLAVEGCKFRVHSLLFNFRSLRILNMKRVHITDNILMNMVEHCPSLETLAIKRCKELRTLRFGNSTLTSLCITSCRELEAFSMDVPNLTSFEFDAFHRRDNVDNNIVYREIRGFKGYRVNSFISLTTLFLAHVTMNVETFQVMFSSFPKLEKLTLRFCRIMGRPQITGEKIKFVILEDCDSDVNILAQNIECLTCTMNLKSHRFNPTSGLGFQHLRNLLLQGEIIVQDETFQALVGNCPLLKNLKMKFCIGLKHLKILSHSLESLVVEECRDIEDGDINAPALSYFKYVGPILRFSRVIISDQLEVEFYLLGFSQRHRVNYFSQPYHGLRNLLWIFDHSRIITFHCEFVKASTLVEAVWNRLGRVTLDTSSVNSLPALYYLKHLQMKTTLGDISYIDLLSGLFGLSMCCGCLLIDLESSSIALKFQDPQEGEDVWTPSSQRLIHDCVRDHLLEVEMKNFEGRAEEMEIVQFLLEKAMFLKTMSISFNQKTCEESNADESGYVEKTMATICNYFKTSPSIEITFTCFF